MPPLARSAIAEARFPGCASITGAIKGAIGMPCRAWHPQTSNDSLRRNGAGGVAWACRLRRRS
ncbi:hypothetical protein C9I56_37815 [Paraburkholderia caribensis]|nr:hypothetical protein C9I56_37815 [Paraburkholderia caribensis]